MTPECLDGPSGLPVCAYGPWMLAKASWAHGVLTAVLLNGHVALPADHKMMVTPRSVTSRLVISVLRDSLCCRNTPTPTSKPGQPSQASPDSQK